MIKEREVAIREELEECESLPELKAIWCHWQAEAPDAAGDPGVIPMVKGAVKRLRLVGPMTAIEIPQPVAVEERREVVVEKVKSAPRYGRKYQLLNSEVTWTGKPQVHAIMHIISAHAKPGDILDEEQIVDMMIANESILDTRQGGKRIWDYYKGEHNQGLVAHGNMRRL